MKRLKYSTQIRAINDSTAIASISNLDEYIRSAQVGLFVHTISEYRAEYIELSLKRMYVEPSNNSPMIERTIYLVSISACSTLLVPKVLLLYVIES